MRRFLNKKVEDNIGTKYRILILLAYIVNFIMLITFEYCDVDSLTAWSLNFWDLIFGEGNLGDFYEYTQLNLRGAAHANCEGNYLWLLPICVWNFPLWLFHIITGTMLVTNIYSICWMKLFFVVMLMICASAVCKICYLFTGNKEKSIIAYILMMLSPEILMSIGYAGQDEIVYVCTFVWALYFYLIKNYKKSYIFMLVAVTLCPIMIIPVLVLVLDRQKTLLYIVRDVIGLLLPLVIFDFFYRNDEIYQIVKTRHGIAKLGTERLNEIMIPLSHGEISIAMGMLIIIFFWAYMAEHKEDDRNRVMYLVTLTMIVICFFMPSSFYRLFLYLPFVIVIILKAQENMNINLFLLTIVSCCRSFFALTLNYPQNMNMFYIMKNSWLTSLHDKFGLYDYLNHDRGSLGKYVLEGEYIPLLNSMSATCAYIGMGLLLFINYPYRKMGNYKYELKLPYIVSIWVYCICMPFMLVAFFKMLF